MDETHEEGAQTEVPDDLAAFLMHHAYDAGVSDADRLQTFAVVNAFQECDDPAVVEAAMRTIAVGYSGHLEYRDGWRPRPGS